jgi:hypothetical protein
MRPIVEKSLKFAAGAGKFLAPATERKIRQRNRTFRVMSSPLLTVPFTWLTTRTSKSGDLTEYPLCAGTKEGRQQDGVDGVRVQ